MSKQLPAGQMCILYCSIVLHVLNQDMPICVLVVTL
jgi:hypothetical protein